MKNIKPPQTFTQAVYRMLAADRGTPATVQIWMDKEKNPDDRVTFFAVCLAEDFLNKFRIDQTPGESPDFAPDEVELMNHWLELANRAVNWNAIARALLKRFSPAYPRTAWQPAGWFSVN